MYNNCNFLPDLLKIEYSIYTKECAEYLYSVFVNEYKTPFFYRGKIVKPRRDPIVKNKEESFWHMLCGNDFNNEKTNIHIERARRLHWGKAIINNEPCKWSIACECKGILMWSDKYKKNRIKFFLPKFNFLVILDERPNEWTIVTCYYVEDQKMRKDLKEEHYTATKNALHS